MIISTIDFNKIIQQIRTMEQSCHSKSENITLLKNNINKARKVPPQRIPDNVVTMNSFVQLKKINTPIILNIKLVYPEWENTRANRISVFSALGIAVFMRKVGDEVTYSTWKKDNRIKILNIPFQPEASGHFFVKAD